MTTKQPAAPSEAAPKPALTDDDIMESADPEISQWEFQGRAPTRAEVVGLLQLHKDVFGLRYAEFADYVQALPQNKKLKRKRPGSNQVDEINVENWTLYVSVGGRIAMVQRLADKNGWRVDFEPEPLTPTGVPGYISLGETDGGRIIYREYMVVSRIEDGEILGRKPGTAWVPYSGGSQAAGSNPYEKVETSARGRAIAAWGIGVLPGSGIASVEEIQAMWATRDAGAAGPGPRQQQYQQRQQAPARQSRDDLIQEALQLAEQVKQGRGMTDDGMLEQIRKYLGVRLGIPEPIVDGEIQWAKVKDGQIVLLANDLRTTWEQIQQAQRDDAQDANR